MIKKYKRKHLNLLHKKKNKRNLLKNLKSNKKNKKKNKLSI